MFDVNLRYRYPFIAAMAGVGISSTFIAFFNVKAIALSVTGLQGIPSIKPNSFAMCIVDIAISVTIAFSITMTPEK